MFTIDFPYEQKATNFYIFIKSLHDKLYFYFNQTKVVLNFIRIIKRSKVNQHIVSSGLILLVSISCYFSTDLIDYKTVALLLLMTVSISAMLFDILPVLIASTASALIWNFFFIPPTFTFHIDNTEDSLMFLLYFVIASVHAVLTFKIRDEEKKSREKDEKEKSIQLYNVLLNSLSHELRTPISTIIGSVDILQEHKDTISVINQHELLNQIETASLRLNRQVENLLNMSRLETGMLKPNFDWCDVNELIYDVIQKTDTANRIQFNADEHLPLFKLDRGFMEQVLHNLIHNALQHTPEHTRIIITAVQTADFCKICIQDEGPGMPEKELSLAFGKFYRLPNTKTGGSGLGLAIVRGFVEAHNGSVSLENNTCGGLTCTIHIPAETSFVNNLKNE